MKTKSRKRRLFRSRTDGQLYRRLQPEDMSLPNWGVLRELQDLSRRNDAAGK